MSSICEMHNRAILKKLPEGYTKKSFCDEANHLRPFMKIDKIAQKIFTVTAYLAKNFLFGLWEGILVSILHSLGWNVLLTQFMASQITPYLKENTFEQTDAASMALRKAFHYEI